MIVSVGVVEKEKESKNHKCFGILMCNERKGIESSYYAPQPVWPSLRFSLNAFW